MPLIQNPFEIFPEEVWELILDQLKNQQDIQNAIEAIPELTILSNGKQFSWLIGSLMPLIMSKYLHLDDVKSCRLVSKRWRNSIEICFESHPDRCLHKSGTPAENHFNYNTCRILTNMSTFCKSGFYNNLENSNLNPFPGRMVYIYVEDETSLDDPSKPNRDRYHFPHMIKLSEVIPPIKIFGEQIWHVTFNIPFLSYVNDESIIKRVFKPMIQCLSFLPNLKCLQIVAFSLPSCSLSETSIKEISKFPPPPFRLEIFDIRFWHMGTGKGNFDYDLHHHLFKYFVTHDKIKKLTLHSTFWESQFAPLFSNLNELCMRTRSLKAVNQIFQDLCESPIRKVLIEVILEKISVLDLLKILEPYQVESLDLRGFSLLSSNRHFKHEMENMLYVSSVKCLHMRVDKSLKGFGLKFLQLFPSLEYLRIEAITGVSAVNCLSQGNNKEGEKEDPSDFVRTNIYNLFHKREYNPRNFEFMWNQFPKLQILTILANKYTSQYIRESPLYVFRTENPRH